MPRQKTGIALGQASCAAPVQIGWHFTCNRAGFGCGSFVDAAENGSGAGNRGYFTVAAG